MFRKLLIGTALMTALAMELPTAVFAQPPSPGEIVHRAERGVHHAVSSTDRALRRGAHRRHRYVRHVTTTRVVRRSRALCNDGRVHYGRTRVTACIGHGGIRG